MATGNKTNKKQNKPQNNKKVQVVNRSNCIGFPNAYDFFVLGISR